MLMRSVGRPEDWEPIQVLDERTLEVVPGPLCRVPGIDEILIAYTSLGFPRAIDARCPHRGSPLAEYARSGMNAGSLVCTAHGYEFDVATGRCLNRAGRPEEFDLPTWLLVDQPDGTKAVEMPAHHSSRHGGGERPRCIGVGSQADAGGRQRTQVARRMDGPEGPAVVGMRIAPEIFDRFPGYRATVVHASGVIAGPSDARSVALLQGAEHVVRERFTERPLSEHPHIAAWRSAYTEFGSKGNRFHCSAEALLRRALKDGVPSITRLVDLYNAVSMQHVLPIGGEDCDRADGDVILRFAEGGERFETREGGQVVTVPVDRGEVIWIDGAGVTCRRWNWRQCVRTALTDRTVDAYFVLDALAPYTDQELAAATRFLVGGLQWLSPGCEIRVTELRRDRPH